MKAQSLSAIAKELKVPIRRLRAIEGDRCKQHGMPAYMIHGTDWRGKPNRNAATFKKWLGEGYAYYANYREACAYLSL